jgi:Ni2+-binding GTPase involved in maturation of urease and hydrogenase
LQRIVKAMNPSIQIFPVSAKTGEGIGNLAEWLENQIHQAK